MKDIEKIRDVRDGLGKSSEGNIAAQTVLSITCDYLGREKSPTVAGMQELLRGIRESCGEAIRDIDAALRVSVTTLNNPFHSESDKAVTMVLQSIRVCFGGIFPRQETKDALHNLSKIAEIMEKELGREDK